MLLGDRAATTCQAQGRLRRGDETERVRLGAAARRDHGHAGCPRPVRSSSTLTSSRRTTLVVRVLNGTFSKSEGAVSKDRVRDITVVTPTRATPLDTAAWAAEGDTSILTVSTRESGTYVIGASLGPRELKLEAKDFNDYLAHVAYRSC